MNDTNSLSISLQAWGDLFISHSMHSWMAFVRASGLSMPQFSLLMRLHYHGQCDIGDASEHLGITKAAGSQMVDKLVEMGYLTRVEDPQDRRHKVLELTLAAKQLLQQGQTVRNQWIAQLVALLPIEKHAALANHLQVLTDYMSQLVQANKE